MTAAVLAMERERSFGLINLTYISDCLIPADAQGPAVAALLAHARMFNRANRITGALLFTGAHFVQTIEGRGALVDLLMARIVADTRHQMRAVVDRRAVTVRKFSGWSMAYSGPSLFVARQVSRALVDAGTAGEINPLLQLMRAFTLPESPRRMP